jgi:hypothetical protein
LAVATVTDAPVAAAAASLLLLLQPTPASYSCSMLFHLHHYTIFPPNHSAAAQSDAEQALVPVYLNMELAQGNTQAFLILLL